MERITSLIDQLNQARERAAGPGELLVLVQQLQAALQQQLRTQSAAASARVAVVFPAAPVLPDQCASENVSEVPAAPIKTAPPIVQPKVVEVLQVDESELEAELEEIRRKAEFANKLQAKQSQLKPGILFEFEAEADTPPTLQHQPHYKPSAFDEKMLVQDAPVQTSLNEQLREEKVELAHRLGEAPIKDLKKAIGINDRYVFINDLFRGDEVMYERSIKTINNFSIYAEAQYWMERELKIKLGWDDERAATQEFYALVRRRFS